MKPARAGQPIFDMRAVFKSNDEFRSFLEDMGVSIFFTWILRCNGGRLELKMEDVVKYADGKDHLPVIRASFDRDKDCFVFEIIESEDK